MTLVQKAAVVSGVALGPLLFYVNACGNIHESPCGLAAIPAVVLVLPALFLPFGGSKWLDWTAIALSTFIITTGVAWVVLRLRASVKR